MSLAEASSLECSRPARLPPWRRSQAGDCGVPDEVWDGSRGQQEGRARVMPDSWPLLPPLRHPHPLCVPVADAAPPARECSVSSASPSLPLSGKSPTDSAQNKNKKGSMAAPQPPPLPLLKLEAASEGVLCGLPGEAAGSLQHQHFLGALSATHRRRGSWRGPHRGPPRQTRDRASLQAPCVSRLHTYSCPFLNFLNNTVWFPAAGAGATL
ncbi:unnamed protein product [Gulo gulo]|uniref:Uncharacterized protein n=1 Tax=Gulo gulo TaxID=48420 RepID=A0A9X9LLJ4_GULGU|nr:unnamed protein product [Gulo gulo]